jgi:hypothetical protein
MIDRIPTAKGRFILFAIVTLALAARLLRMGLSVSNDEPFSIIVAGNPWRWMDRLIVFDVVHPPLHYYLLHAWFDLFGTGVLRARSISVVFGVAAVPVLFLLGRYLFDRTTGLIAALLFSLAPLPAIYAQIARPYSMHLFLSLIASYLFIVAIRERRRDYWWAFVACAALTIYTLYYGVFVLIALAVFLLLFRTRYPIPATWWAGGALAMAVAYLPWLMHAIVPRLTSHKAAPGTMPGLPIHWYTPITILNRFNSSPHDPSPLWAFVVGAILFTVPALAALRRLGQRANSSEREGTLFALMLAALPIVALMLLGLLHVRFQPRYVLFCVPYYLLLVASGIRGLSHSALQASLLSGIAAYSCLALWDHSFRNPATPDTRRAISVLAKNSRSGDCAVFDPLREILLQWNNDYGMLPFRAIRWTTQPPGLEGCSRIWVVSMDQRRWRNIAAALTEKAELLERQSFYRIQVALFQPGGRKIDTESSRR